MKNLKSENLESQLELALYCSLYVPNTQGLKTKALLLKIYLLPDTSLELASHTATNFKFYNLNVYFCS